MDVEIHRSSRTYYPHSTTLLNVPTRDLDSFLRSAGWQAVIAAKFLRLPEVADVQLNDLISRTASHAPRADVTSTDLDELLDSGLPPEEVIAMIRSRRETRQIEAGTATPEQLSALVIAKSGVDAVTWEDAGDELLDAVLPVEGRMTADVGEGGSREPLMDSLGFDTLTLVPDFPIVTATFGFSRVDYQPTSARLNAFPPDPSHDGKTPIFVDQVGADAILLRLDPERIVSWLESNGAEVAVPTGDDASASRRAYFVRLLSGINVRETIPSSHREAQLVFGLVHSMSHLAIRRAALLCGLEQTSLSEYILPRALSTALYCNHRFGATIGALTALFQDAMPSWLGSIAEARRCIYDPVCSDRGGACHACLHLAETSCRFFNLNLSRAFLWGGVGTDGTTVEVGYLNRP